jgi:hypothetical protein
LDFWGLDQRSEFVEVAAVESLDDILGNTGLGEDGLDVVDNGGSLGRGFEDYGVSGK